MAQTQLSPEGAGVLRALLRAAVEVAGLFLAARRVHKRYRARKRARPETNATRRASALAAANRETDNPKVTHCLFCGRSDRDARTYGCGDPNLEGPCPMPHRSE